MFQTVRVLCVTLVAAGSCFGQAANDPCGIPATATKVSGSHADNLYVFTHTSWYENPTPNVVTIGYCVSVPAQAQKPLWCDWPRAGLKNYTNTQSKCLKASVSICFPPGAQPQSPETNLWYGARPDVIRAELFDFNGRDEDAAVAGYQPTVLEGMLASVDVPVGEGPLSGSTLPRLHSRCEFSVPAPDKGFETGFADVDFRFESQIVRIATEDPGAPSWLYVYTWSNEEVLQREGKADISVGRIILPPTLTHVLATELDWGGRVQRQGLAPRQRFESFELICSTDERPRKDSVAFFHTKPPHVEVVPLGISDNSKTDDRPDGSPAEVPVAIYRPGF